MNNQCEQCENFIKGVQLTKDVWTRALCKANIHIIGEIECDKFITEFIKKHEMEFK